MNDFLNNIKAAINTPTVADTFVIRIDKPEVDVATFFHQDDSQQDLITIGAPGVAIKFDEYAAIIHSGIAEEVDDEDVGQNQVKQVFFADISLAFATSDTFGRWIDTAEDNRDDFDLAISDLAARVTIMKNIFRTNTLSGKVKQVKVIQDASEEYERSPGLLRSSDGELPKYVFMGTIGIRGWTITNI